MMGKLFKTDYMVLLLYCLYAICPLLVAGTAASLEFFFNPAPYTGFLAMSGEADEVEGYLDYVSVSWLNYCAIGDLYRRDASFMWLRIKCLNCV